MTKIHDIDYDLYQLDEARYEERLEGDYEDDLSDFDGDLVEVVNKRFPDWTLMRITYFTHNTYNEIQEWLKDPVNSLGRYEIVGWSSGCSTSHGVVFERKIDAMLFKLTWC